MHCFAKCECLQIKWKYRSYCQNAQFAYNKIIFYYSLPSRINFIFLLPCRNCRDIEKDSFRHWNAFVYKYFSTSNIHLFFTYSIYFEK